MATSVRADPVDGPAPRADLSAAHVNASQQTIRIVRPLSSMRPRCWSYCLVARRPTRSRATRCSTATSRRRRSRRSSPTTSRSTSAHSEPVDGRFVRTYCARGYGATGPAPAATSEGTFATSTASGRATWAVTRRRRRRPCSELAAAQTVPDPRGECLDDRRFENGSGCTTSDAWYWAPAPEATNAGLRSRISTMTTRSSKRGSGDCGNRTRTASIRPRARAG